MSGRLVNKVFVAAVMFLSAAFAASAQTYGSYSPYSIYGVGDIMNPGTAVNRSMGGVGIAMRNNRIINPVNPAAITARDSLAFMVDFSLYEDNKIFAQGDMKSAYNTCNIGDLIMTFPIYRSSAMMVGIMPYSSTGFNYGSEITDLETISKIGNAAYTASGQGSLYQGFVAAGVTFWKKLSLGVEGIYYFGSNTKKYYQIISDNSFNEASNGFVMNLNAFSAKFGVQFEQRVGVKSKIGIGATYTMGTGLNGYVENFRFSSGSAASDTLRYELDTLAYRKGADKVRLASEIGVGLSYRYGDKFVAELDYTRSDWRNSNMDIVGGFAGNTVAKPGSSVFASSVSEAFRAGMEFTPNRNDIRYYFKKVTYRAGAYYKKDYFTVDGNGIKSAGITFGATLPVFMWYNGLTVGVELGQRGSIKDNMIRENYINFSFGVNLFDIWFRKMQYE